MRIARSHNTGFKCSRAWGIHPDEVETKAASSYAAADRPVSSWEANFSPLVRWSHDPAGTQQDSRIRREEIDTERPEHKRVKWVLDGGVEVLQCLYQ